MVLYKVICDGKDTVAEGNSVVIFQSYCLNRATTTTHIIGSAWAYDQTPENERREIISQFQANELPILVCQARAGEDLYTM